MTQKRGRKRHSPPRYACCGAFGVLATRPHSSPLTKTHALHPPPSPPPPNQSQVVEFDPSALLTSPGVLNSRVRNFKSLANSCRPWRLEFQQLMAQPANVARALNLDALRLQRLAYLAGTGRQELISMRAALTLSPSQFRRAYPRFEDWRAAGAGGVQRGGGGERGGPGGGRAAVRRR